MVIDWPASSLDFNSIKIILCILNCTFYKSGQQYYSIKELNVTVEKLWYSLSPIVFQNIFILRKHNCFKLYEPEKYYLQIESCKSVKLCFLFFIVHNFSRPCIILSLFIKVRIMYIFIPFDVISLIILRK